MRLDPNPARTTEACKLKGVTCALRSVSTPRRSNELLRLGPCHRLSSARLVQKVPREARPTRRRADFAPRCAACSCQLRSHHQVAQRPRARPLVALREHWPSAGVIALRLHALDRAGERVLASGGLRSFSLSASWDPTAIRASSSR